MKKPLILFLLSCISIAFVSCDPDDAPAATTNNFKIGSANYPLSRGFRSASFADSPGLFLTYAVLASDGLTLNASQDLSGNGNIVAFEFYTASNNGLQPGVYDLDDVNDQPQTVYVYTGVGYNGNTGDALIENDILQGSITVEILANGDYKITGQGRADGANAPFTVNYTGPLQLVNP